MNLDFDSLSGDPQQKVEEQAELYQMGELAAMARQNYEDLIVTLGAFLKRCEAEGKSIAQASPSQLGNITDTIIGSDVDPSKVPLEALIMIVQGGIIGFAHEDGEGLESVTAALGRLAERLQ